MSFKVEVKMNEMNKIEEAEHFLKQMEIVQEAQDVKEFRHNLSAFLTATRSVLQYAMKQAKSVKDGQRWYENSMTNSPVFSFFKEKRDTNIHEKPVTPKRNTHVIIDTFIQASPHIAIMNKSLKVTKKHDLSEKKTVSKTSNISVNIRYIFPDWSGTDDVLLLCQKYINELRILIADGIVKGFLIAT